METAATAGMEQEEDGHRTADSSSPSTSPSSLDDSALTEPPSPPFPIEPPPPPSSASGDGAAADGESTSESAAAAAAAAMEKQIAEMDALSDDEIREKFAATRQMRKVRRNVEGACGGCRGPLLEEHRGWYQNHTRVLIIDGTEAVWNGLGMGHVHLTRTPPQL